MNETYETDNILARIARGELPSTRVFEDGDVIAIMDIFPQSDGHVLVLHKRAQATNLLDIDPQALSTLALALQKVASAVARALAPDGVRIMQLNGAPAGQTIFHLHFHVIPVYGDTPLQAHAARKADAGALEAIAARIRAAF